MTLVVLRDPADRTAWSRHAVRRWERRVEGRPIPFTATPGRYRFEAVGFGPDCQIVYVWDTTYVGRPLAALKLHEANMTFVTVISPDAPFPRGRDLWLVLIDRAAHEGRVVAVPAHTASRDCDAVGRMNVLVPERDEDHGGRGTWRCRSAAIAALHEWERCDSRSSGAYCYAHNPRAEVW